MFEYVEPTIRRLSSIKELLSPKKIPVTAFKLNIPTTSCSFLNKFTDTHACSHAKRFKLLIYKGHSVYQLFYHYILVAVVPLLLSTTAVYCSTMFSRQSSTSTRRRQSNYSYMPDDEDPYTEDFVDRFGDRIAACMAIICFTIMCTICTTTLVLIYSGTLLTLNKSDSDVNYGVKFNVTSAAPTFFSSWRPANELSYRNMKPPAAATNRTKLPLEMNNWNRTKISLEKNSNRTKLMPEVNRQRTNRTKLA